MDQKRLALERAIAVYMEEGPVPTTDFHLDGGKPGCQTEALVVKGGAAGVTHPSWPELINGDTYKVVVVVVMMMMMMMVVVVVVMMVVVMVVVVVVVVMIYFDLPENLDDNIKRETEAFVTYAENRWSCHAPGSQPHAYDSHVNGGSGDTKNMKLLGELPHNLVGSIVGRTEFVSPLEHSHSNSGALASIVEAPCTVKWSNSYQIKPAEYGGRCLYFIAASSGDIFVVFSAIPRDKTTWYHLQISFQGVALYKEKGLVYMVYIDDSQPLGIQFYSFGSGEEPVEVMDARVIEGGATGEMECSGGTVMNEDGICVEDCHPECNAGQKVASNGVTCTCERYVIKNDDGTTQCVSACPANHKVASDGVTCEPEDIVHKWRPDGRCGPGYATRIADPGECDPNSIKYCCSSSGMCGSSDAHCLCRGCVDYRPVVRPDGRCGNNFQGHGGNPGQCDPSSVTPCCGPNGYCGGSDAHCRCSDCVDFRPRWRPDTKCGLNDPAPGSSVAQCNPKGPAPCCSLYGWCGGSPTHCSCSGCIDYRNLAIKRPVAQSTILNGMAAVRAVDGNKNGDAKGGGSCSHTDLAENNWWRVDLGIAQAIGNVVVYNRMDCCGDRLNGFKVHVGGSTNVASNPLCGGVNRVSNGQETITVSCQGRKGRYVGITLAHRQYLTLCEVMVYGGKNATLKFDCPRVI
ncbi:Hypp8047 [Branchiostoma lanceolatum]|uniref:Hypp8047 protein n=1 Tax=Branchiostoma lanceolatum TaxID=7740 RepID=A0A8J9Z588_BRALA|nr:Hypp8047 [Branchiostoma lanceolatum]